MRIWLVAIALAALVINGEKPKANTGADKEHPAHAVEQTDSAAARSVIVVNQQAPQGQQDSHPPKPPSYLSRLFSPENLPNIGLFIAGVVGITIALCTLQNIAKQTRLLWIYTAATRRGVRAAKKSAEAASDSIELIINKERARIRVEMDRHWIDVCDAERIVYPKVTYMVEIYGPSAAFIEDAEASAYIADSADAQPPHPTNVPIGLPSVIKPDAPRISRDCYIFPKMELDQSDVDTIHQGTSFLHFRGTIRYKDVFGKDRHTAFKYLGKVCEPFSDGTPYGYWLKLGKKEDNEET